MGQPAQDVQPPPDGVAAGGQPLVRQRLPGRVHGHPLARDEIGQRGRQVLRLPGGGGDREHRTTRAATIAVGRERRRHHGAQRCRAGDVQLILTEGGCGLGECQLTHPRQGRIVECGRQQTSEQHAISNQQRFGPRAGRRHSGGESKAPVGRHARVPPAGSGRGCRTFSARIARLASSGTLGRAISVADVARRQSSPNRSGEARRSGTPLPPLDQSHDHESPAPGSSTDRSTSAAFRSSRFALAYPTVHIGTPKANPCSTVHTGHSPHRASHRLDKPEPYTNTPGQVDALPGTSFNLSVGRRRLYSLR